MRKRVFIYGNCQAGWIHNFLSIETALREDFEFIYQASFGVTPDTHPARQPGFHSSCDMVLWQTAPRTPPPDFVAQLRADCAQFRFPTLWLKALWPLHCSDPRNQAEEGFPAGPWPYGDRLVMKLVEEGVAPGDLPARYLDYDLGKLVNLERYAEIGMAELRMNDRQSDVQVAPLIEGGYRTRRLFATVNHPNLGLLDWLRVNARAWLLGEAPPSVWREPEYGLDPFGEIEIPLHPKVVETFGLTWVKPGMGYRYNERFLTLEEWLAAYAAFERIPIQTPPTVVLSRAQQAQRHGEVLEAMRILGNGAALFPHLHHFVRYLALLLMQSKCDREAEKVLMEAIVRHPAETSLAGDLCKLLARQSRWSELVQIADVLLRLEPANAEIAQLRRGAFSRLGAGGSALMTGAPS